MKSIISISFILTILFLPQIGAIGYLAVIGDMKPVYAIAEILSLPGNMVLSLLS